MTTVNFDVRRPGSRLQSLTGLRFLAALLVFGFHLSLNRHLLGEGGVPAPGPAALAGRRPGDGDHPGAADGRRAATGR
ncbi:hypothetical protein [Micromonospora sp. ATCC 39149]|uniref:Acyltransferase family protein n=1 Tax=Micromonospora carbonacea TaxID=47853 RepID=A0A7D5YGS3_9ACTN|nr:hypothetical protein [Micromonospora sp. ATCC 39149]QLJ97334.1 hypothetical protein HZU44_21220 [Micromonospora carbonacea]